MMSMLVEVASIFEKSHSDLSLYVLLPSASSRLQGLGLGWLIYDARNFGRPDDMIVGMLTSEVVILALAKPRTHYLFL